MDSDIVRNNLETSILSIVLVQNGTLFTSRSMMR
jgi:hypothetical protein